MRDELVRAVIADPDADAPRVAFASWGATRGDLQAELTRLQLADRDERCKRGRSGQNRNVTNRLVEQHGATWAKSVVAIASHPRFARGFVEGVTLDAPTFLARANDLYAIAPIRAVTFLDAARHVAAIASSPHLARLRSIHFYNKSGASPLGDAGLRAFLASPHLGKLARLDLASNEITRDGIEALCSVRLLALAYVGLHNNHEGSPVEEYSNDPESGIIITDSVTQTPLGRELEAKHGRQAWLHAPSLLRVLPPDEGDF